MTLAINYRGQYGDAKLYAIQLGRDRVEAIVGNGNSCLRMDGEVLDSELTTLVIEEMRDLVSKDATGILLQGTNQLLESLGLKPAERKEEDSGEAYRDLSELRSAFKEWNGMPTPRQRRVLTELGLEYIDRGNHPRISERDNSAHFVIVSKTPSDVRAGKNIVTKIKRLLGGGYEK